MATYSALPATLNLVATVGNDFTLSLTVTENGSPWVATGATLATDIIDSSGTVVATDFTTAASTGTVSLSLTDANTTTLGVGVYSYRLSVTKSSLTRDWIAGTLSIVEAGQGGTSTSSASLSISNSAVTLSLTSLVAPLAENITVADAGGYYTGTTVEAVLAEAALKEIVVGLAAKAAATKRDRIPAGVAGPTISNNATTGLSGRLFTAQQYNNFRVLGTATTGLSYTVANSIQPVANYTGSAAIRQVWGCEVDFYGTSLEFAYFTRATSARIWVWVDGVPCTDAPNAYTGLTTSTTYFHRVVFGTTAQRRVTFYIDEGDIRYLKSGAATDTMVAAAPRPWRVAILGDSFVWDSTANVPGLNALGFLSGLLMGADVVTCGMDGSGYTISGGNASFSDAARLAALATSDPDLVIVMGSLNDDGASGIQAAAASCYSQLATLLPKVPVIVFGPQPDGDTASLSANRIANIAAVQAAAAAASNVIGFVDMIGVTSSTYAFTGSPNITLGDRVTYQGGVYEATQTQASAGAPNNVGYWRQIGPYYGTGRVGALATNGNRDIFVRSDDVHPTAEGHRALAAFIASETLRVLQDYTD